ncbi:serine/threonine-protein kinase CDL1 [Panicum miliaceum]|uniref:non-specific serine/threonine protein kinase n=1 Tax=Panicum miliaceum TaxID=4540 RepID=A0A3L6QS51_PANMI|nr:serine/threonine-protein kinase CDL1 [Panicum miliaceum]
MEKGGFKMFNIVSSWNKRRRSRSLDQLNPWVYKPAELWQAKEQSPPPKKRSCTMVFTLKEMEEATNMFSDRNLIGKGGFGRVYRGVLKDGQLSSEAHFGLLEVLAPMIQFGREIVAIKKMDLPTSKHADGEREFRVEIDILSRLDHPNLVMLIGYCADGKHRFVVYEFMPKGNLQDILNGIGEVKMDWPLRLRIALGAARALAYLHSSTAVGVPVVHRDFKSSNILLTEHFEAKISDFGLAKLMQQDQDLHTTTRVLGTFGYFDPEYALTGKLTLQSDVYAFGVVLLELLTGRRAIDLSQGPQEQNLIVGIHQAVGDRKKLLRVVDRDMAKGSYTVESVSMFAGLAARCVSFDGAARPSMPDCVKELQFIMYANMKI